MRSLSRAGSSSDSSWQPTPPRRGSSSIRTHPTGRCLRSRLPRPGVASGWLERYFQELRDVRLEISGGDLAALGLEESPRVGEVLDEILRRKLNGELDGRDSELAAARALIGA